VGQKTPTDSNTHKGQWADEKKDSMAEMNSRQRYLTRTVFRCKVITAKIR
jgi:hypothetical protein